VSPVRDSDDRRPPINPQMAIRVAMFGGVALALFAVIFFRLWFLQVLSGDQYVVQARENRTREIRIQAPRGEIVDRHGSVLVDNRPANVVQIEPQSLPDDVISDAAAWGQAVGRRLQRPEGQRGDPVALPPIATDELRRRYERLGRVLGMRATTIHRQVIEQLAQLPYSAVTIRSDAPNSVLGYIKERQEHFPGVDVERIYLRDYPRGQLAAQLLGYVGEISPDELEQRRNRGIKQGTIIGKAGIEYSYDRYLRGEDGAKILRVDANGRFRDDPRRPLRQRQPVPGRRLQTSLDLGLQRNGQDGLRAVGGGLPGAFVAMNPRDGRVYAMGSYPSFDPSVFAKPISQARYESLTSEENGAPLINRALNGMYPTGSTFKPITALAALDKGTVGTSSIINDPGCMQIGNRRVCNARETPYGPVDLRKAMQVSSDVYFYTQGRDLFGVEGEPLQRWSKRLGLGRRTGIDLPGEQRGTIPGREWREEVNEREEDCRKREKVRQCYYPEIRPYNVGDNVNLAIGQGEMSASPLQMAVAYSTIVTKGKVPRPHLGLEVQDANGALVQKIEPGPAREVEIKDEWRQALMDGLGLAARQAPGTSAGVFAGWPHDRLPVFGKTGTAETFVKGVPYDQSWYVAYVPHETKPIVIAATIERGGFGADRAAPLVRRMLAKWFDLGPEQARPSADAEARQAAD
jgi:penicillin-binding protein 2